MARWQVVQQREFLADRKTSSRSTRSPHLIIERCFIAELFAVRKPCPNDESVCPNQEQLPSDAHECSTRPDTGHLWASRSPASAPDIPVSWLGSKCRAKTWRNAVQEIPL